MEDETPSPKINMYKINKYKLTKNLEKISATKIRKGLRIG